MDLGQVGRPHPGAPSSPLCPVRGPGSPPPEGGNAELVREWVRDPGFWLPRLFCFRVREDCPLASRLSEPPAWPAELGPMRPGQEPELDLCPSGKGSQVTQPLQGLAGLQGWGPGQEGSSVLSRSLHADSLGMLQAGGQAAGRQRAPQDGQAALGDGRVGDRQMGAETWGPAAQKRLCRDRPERSWGQESRPLMDKEPPGQAGHRVGAEARVALEKMDDSPGNP